MANSFIRKLLKTPEQGADTLVWLATNRKLWEDGAYYYKRQTSSTNYIGSDVDSHKIIWNSTEKLLDISTK
jgi:hypothetical protein